MKYWSLVAIFWSLSASANLVVEDAWVKLLPPSVPNSAGYFVIHNTGEEDQALVSASAGFAAKAELHAHVMEAGMMRMEQQSKVVVPAGQSVTFEPGGLHVMLFGLNRVLTEQQRVDFELVTVQGQRVSVSATVRKPQSASHKHHH